MVTKKSKYSSIQLTIPARDSLKNKKKKNESYEDYLRRIGAI